MHDFKLENWISLLTDLIRRTATDLPQDVAAALRSSLKAEDIDGSACSTLRTILENADLARTRTIPMCQDTGTLTFWFEVPYGSDASFYEQATCEAVRKATENGWLRLNVLNVPSSSQVPDNVAPGNPTIHIEQRAVEEVKVSLLLKGGGCENVSTQYSLPDTELKAGRDLDGVRRCLLDAVWRAQGNGCAPGILGVCIGGDRASGYGKAKEQLLRLLPDTSPSPELAELENRVFAEANTLGIGPMGLGGKTTLLGVKVSTLPRLPASYFVTVAYSCWACRRQTILVSLDGQIRKES